MVGSYVVSPPLLAYSGRLLRWLAPASNGQFDIDANQDGPNW
jgi:hypothetical protein